MALVINTNVASLQTQKALQSNQSSLDTAIQRLSSGLRINSAADDAAGLSIANRMDSQIRGLNQAVKNAGDAISLAQASEGAMDEITAMLQRMRELSVQASNGVLTTADRSNLQDEVAQLKSEIDRVVSTTTFNGKQVLDGSFGESMQIGTQAGDTISVGISNMSTGSLGGITGASSDTAIVQANASGVEAKTTETLIDFSANDTYSFSVTVGVDGNEYTYAVTGEVENGSAKQLVDLLNDKLSGKPDAIDKGTVANITASQISIADLSSVIEVSYVGRQLTIKNLQGGDINVKSGATLALTGTTAVAISGSLSSGGGQAFVSAVNGASNGSTSGVLADSQFTRTSLKNTNTTAYAAPVTTATAGTAAITFGSTGLTLTSANTFKVSVGGTSVTVGLTGSTATTANIATAVKEAISAAAITGFSVAVSGSTVTVTKADGSAFNLAVHTVSSNTLGPLTVSDTGATGASLTVGTTGKSITGGSPVSSGSTGGVMYLDLLNNDTYTFSFADDATTPAAITSVQVTYDGTAQSLEAAAVAINSGLQNAASAYSFAASVSEGRIKIVESKGKAFELSNFASVGAGKVVASVETGQGASSVDAVLLDDIVPGITFTTKGAGVAKKTDIDLSFFGHGDTFSFSISDGTATARVSATAGQTAVTASATTMKNAITTALARAGLDDVMSVAAVTSRTAGNAAGDYTLTIEHKLGYQVTMADFASDSSGQVLFKSGSTDTSGQAVFLNDDLGGLSADQVVSSVDISTTNGASSAIDVIDRAIADVDSERAKLGAVQNRLNHTVSNLINISTNTSDAKSRIMDADYAMEAANLAKSQIMQQASTAMLAQANASQQSILSLLT